MSEKPTRDSVLRDFEQRIATLVATRLMNMKSSELKQMNFKKDDMPMIDISLDEYKEAIRITIKAEWIPVEDTIK